MRILSVVLLLIISATGYSAYWDGQLSYAPPMHGRRFGEPHRIRGGRVAVRYLPTKLDYRDIRIFLEGSYAHYRTPWRGGKDVTNIVGLAPVVRLIFANHSHLHPYIEVGIGGSWHSQSHFAGQRLGGHWQFQDMAGAGIRFGNDQRYYFAAHVIHYSNAGFCRKNMGITVPLLLSLGMQF